jgi:hypothetical protein
MQKPNNCVVALTLQRWHEEVGFEGDRWGWPGELVAMVRGLISAMVHNVTSPTATEHLAVLAQTYLGAGIMVGQILYEVMVLVPDSGERDRRSLFILVPKYAGAKVRRLEEVYVPRSNSC